MLTQETLVEIHVLHSHGESIRAIAQKLGVSRNTVRLYLRDLSAVPTYPDRTQRATKLDPYKDYLLARIPMCQRSCRLIISEDNHAPLLTGT